MTARWSRSSPTPIYPEFDEVVDVYHRALRVRLGSVPGDHADPGPNRGGDHRTSKRPPTTGSPTWSASASGTDSPASSAGLPREQATNPQGRCESRMRVWIDLSNSPHPLLFEPIARQLEASGAVVSVTARDNAQTVELARQRWRDVEVIGGPSPPGRAAKGGSMLERVRALASWARRERPDVALSHNSYAQIVAARLLRIRVVTAMDYEHQPANHLAFRLADTVLLPAALESSRLRALGATRARRTSTTASRRRSTSGISSRPRMRSPRRVWSETPAPSWWWRAHRRRAPSITVMRTRFSSRLSGPPPATRGHAA